MNAAAAAHWSIGEILSLIQDEFPEVTISKIRFLEGQGLIAPERTPSGYRRFYPSDFEQLQWILTQQRDHYLPLRVIRQQLDSGEVDFSNPGEKLPDPRQPSFFDSSGAAVERGSGAEAPDSHKSLPEVSESNREAPAIASAHEETPKRSPDTAEGDSAPEPPVSVESTATNDPDAGEVESGSQGQLAITIEELGEMSDCSASLLRDLERHGLLQGRTVGPTTLYGSEDLEIAKLAVEFGHHGLDPRHLRSFRLAAEREVGLFAQVIGPQLLRKDPEARNKSLIALGELNGLAASLHHILVTRTTRDQLPNP